MEEIKMEINEFVEKIKEDGFENIESFIKTNYIPVKIKQDIALRTLEQCTRNDNGFIHLDQFIENIYFSRSVNTRRVIYPFILSPLLFIRSFVPFGSVIDILS